MCRMLGMEHFHRKRNYLCTIHPLHDAANIIVCEWDMQ